MVDVVNGGPVGIVGLPVVETGTEADGLDASGLLEEVVPPPSQESFQDSFAAPTNFPVARFGNSASAKVFLRDDEDRIAGVEWRKQILPEVLRHFGYRVGSAWDMAFTALTDKVLTDPHTSVNLKIVALRVMGDNLRELNTVERLLTTLQLIAEIAECFPRIEGAMPQLGESEKIAMRVVVEMALALLHQIDRPPVDVTLTDFSLKNFFEGALRKKERHAMLINGRSAPTADLDANIDRIRNLKVRIFPLLSQGRGKREKGWDAGWPAWYAVLPDLFGEQRDYFKNYPSAVFLDRNIDLWQRALALVYYSFSVHLRLQTLTAGDGHLSPLIRNDEDPLLKQMAAAVSANIARLTKDSAPRPVVSGGPWWLQLWHRFFSS